MFCKNKIILISPYPHENNGVSNYTKHYIDEFEKNGYQVSTRKMYFLANKLEQWKWIWWSFSFKKNQYLVQHIPTISGPFLLVFLLIKKIIKHNVIVVSHEVPSTYSKYLKGVLKKIYYWYEKKVVELSSHFVVHTDYHKNELKILGAQRNIQVIPHPIYNIDISFCNTSRDYWGFYGQISPKKGLEILMEAIQSFKPGFFPILKVMGKAAPGNEKYFEMLKKSVKKEYTKHILFLGYLSEEDKIKEFSTISLMIFPYKWISQSGALSETCLYNIPYLASDIPFFRDFQEKFGCGILFSAEQQKDLQNKLLELVGEPLVFSPNSFDEIKQNLSMNSCFAMLEKLL